MCDVQGLEEASNARDCPKKIELAEGVGFVPKITIF
jgi:hypothetical protein